MVGGVGWTRFPPPPLLLLLLLLLLQLASTSLSLFFFVIFFCVVFLFCRPQPPFYVLALCIYIKIGEFLCPKVISFESILLTFGTPPTMITSKNGLLELKACIIAFPIYQFMITCKNGKFDFNTIHNYFPYVCIDRLIG